MDEDKKLAWILAGFATFVGLAYIVWLSAVYIKFQETDQYVREHVAAYYDRPAEPPGEESD